MQAMRAAFVFLAPRTHKFPLRIKYDNRVLNRRALADGVLDVNLSLSIHGHAVRVAIDMAGRQFAPVVDDFVLLFALADNRQPITSFIAGQNVDRKSTRLNST